MIIMLLNNFFYKSDQLNIHQPYSVFVILCKCLKCNYFVGSKSRIFVVSNKRTFWTLWRPCGQDTNSIQRFKYSPPALVRQILYKPPDEEEVAKEGTEKKRLNASRTSAYDHYKTYSPTKQQIWQMRREAKEQKKVSKEEGLSLS